MEVRQIGGIDAGGALRKHSQMPVSRDENVVPLRVVENEANSQASKPLSKNSISLVFPAFNEEENIEKAVSTGIEALQRYFAEVEVIVVNDGSTDQTKEILESVVRENDRVTAVHHPNNKGYGAALRSGIYTAKNDLVFFSDADLQFDLREISQLVEWIDDYDIVAGYRAKRADPFHRRLNAWAWNRLVRFTLGLKVRDIDCAFKLFRREVFDVIDLQSIGAMVNTEILALAVKNGMNIMEVPVSHYPRVCGEQTGANIRVIFKAFKELLAMHGKVKLSESVKRKHGKTRSPATTFLDKKGAR